MNTALPFRGDSWRLHAAVLSSLSAHMLLLSMTLGGQAFGLPGLTLPWQERRLGADELRIHLAPAASAMPQATPVERTPAPAPSKPSMGGSAPIAAAPAVPPPSAVPVPAPAVPVPAQAPVVTPAIPTLPAKAVITARPPAEAIAPRVADTALPATVADLDGIGAEMDRQANERTRLAREQERERAQAERAQALEREARKLAQEHAEERARLDEKARQDAARRQAAQVKAAQEEAARRAIEQEAEQQKAQRALAQENARRVEAAQQEAARLEAAKQEAARQQAARLEQARLEQAKLEQAKVDQARQEQARQAQQARERADQEAQREERLRAIGRQLDAEAPQRNGGADRKIGAAPPPSGNLRRGWLFGRSDPNADLVLYAQAMSRKIELNMTLDMVRDVVKQPHGRPIVTVAVRADGSVEKVTFVVSSGVPAIDEAIRKVVDSQAPYGPFAPALARQYDVIEIRRTWIFDVAIRLE